MPPTDFEDVAGISILANSPPLATLPSSKPPPATAPSLTFQRSDWLGQKVNLNLPNALRGGATAVPEKRLAKLITLRRSVRLKA